ncbi:helix-turn-helix domain-containing protein [Croceitalea sp. MTPC5]|uniref:helix-turn-helix domain-containing protein n=1 Tax=Croceitalea sp. MTPC5 TaxID=3056565 RepID=UPI002B3EBBEE|nr:helix-turn-helix domain-containing protein [Croceitalea sp. MTPC5]
MIDQYVNKSDGSILIYTDFSNISYRPLFMDSAFYKVVFCESGSANIIVDGKEFELKENELLFCKPLQSLSVPNLRSKNLKAVAFNKTFFSLQDNDEEVSFYWFWYYGPKQPLKITLKDGEASEYATMFNCFLDEFNKRDKLCEEMLRYVLKRLFVKTNTIVLDDNCLPFIRQNQLQTIRRYNDLIENHFREKHQVAEYASMLSKSPKTLANLFKRYGTKPPSRVLHERIVLEAKRLLLNTPKTADQITHELGYQHAGHFSRFFKKHVGMTPIDYRNKNVESLDKGTLNLNNEAI